MFEIGKMRITDSQRIFSWRLSHISARSAFFLDSLLATIIREATARLKQPASLLAAEFSLTLADF